MLRMRLRYIWVLCLALVFGLVFAGTALGAAVRHGVLDQLDWAAFQGIVVEFQNDTAKDDTIAQMKTCSIGFSLGDGKKWVSANIPASKWEANKDYAVQLVLKPGMMESYLDGKRKAYAKVGTPVMYEGKPTINGWLEWTTGLAAYGVYIKSLKVTTSDGNDFEATYDKGDYDQKMKPMVPTDWQLTDDDATFTIDFVFQFIPEEQ